MIGLFSGSYFIVRPAKFKRVFYRQMLLKESERHLKEKVVDEEKEQNSEVKMPEFQAVLSIP